jgi:hypothetical protein
LSIVANVLFTVVNRLTLRRSKYAHLLKLLAVVYSTLFTLLTLTVWLLLFQQ